MNHDIVMMFTYHFIPQNVALSYSSLTMETYEISHYNSVDFIEKFIFVGLVFFPPFLLICVSILLLAIYSIGKNYWHDWNDGYKEIWKCVSNTSCSLSKWCEKKKLNEELLLFAVRCVECIISNECNWYYSIMHNMMWRFIEHEEKKASIKLKLDYFVLIHDTYHTIYNINVTLAIFFFFK